MSTTVPGIAPERFKQAFRNHPAGVVVVTVDAGHGPTGFTATSLTSLSLAPPLVSFRISTRTSSRPHGVGSRAHPCGRRPPHRERPGRGHVAGGGKRATPFPRRPLPLPLK